MLEAARALAPDHRVYALDLPGFGRSEGPSDGLDVPALADAVAAWLDVMGLRDATIAGSSSGCQVVARLAARHPQRIARIILDGPTVAPQLRSAGRLFLAWLRELPHVPWRLTARALWAVCAIDPRLRWRSLHRVLADHIEDSLASITVPALVIHGARDTIAPGRWASEVARLLPAGRLHVVPGVAHAVGTVAPRAFAAAVHGFVRDVSRRRAA
jgi:2-hydroxy-6-oxonona-2,4-dienedioate hydrolase